MSRPNSYGSRSNRDRRKAVADANAQRPQFHCKRHGRHREGRCDEIETADRAYYRKFLAPLR